MAVAAELSYGRRRRKRIEGFIRVYGEFIKRCRVVMESNCMTGSGIPSFIQFGLGAGSDPNYYYYLRENYFCRSMRCSYVLRNNQNILLWFKLQI
jgi:hypothetical protein